MSGDLSLQFPRVPGNADLPLGRVMGGGDTELTADIPLRRVTVDAAVSVLVDVVADVPLRRVIVDCTGIYLVNVFRGTQHSPAMTFQQADDLWVETSSSWIKPASIMPTVEDKWQISARLNTELEAKFSNLPHLRNEAGNAWSEATAVAQERSTSWDYPPRQQHTTGDKWQDANVFATEMQTKFDYPPRAQRTTGDKWQSATPLATSKAIPYNYPHRRDFERRIPWGEADGLISLWPRPDPYVPPINPPRIISPDLRLICRREPGNADLLFMIGCANAGIIPTQRTYIVIHDITVLRLPDNYPIQASRVSLSIDADAWAWSFSATLLGKDALDAVLPSAQGEPVTLAININGHTWHVLVEDWSENREFGKRGVSVKGRGLSAWLSPPYLLPGNGTTTQDRTMQQLMFDHLPIDSGASITWTSGMADWLVPAGAWSWQNLTPVQAIHKAAQEVGMVVVPGKASRVLTLQPRYPVMPWDFASATPSIIIPDAAILQLQRQQSINTQANAVYIHGGDTGGVLAQVKRLYSAGDRVAPVQSSNLITHVDGARLLGSRILAGQHQQPEVRSVTLPMGGVFNLGEVGQLLRAEVDSVAHHGIINSIAIEAARSDTSATVRQTLTIGEDTQNQWAKFKRLLPYDPLLIGTIESQHADGTATVTMLGGGTQRVRGSGSAGQAVYVRGGMIEGQAQQLSQVVVDV